MIMSELSYSISHHSAETCSVKNYFLFTPLKPAVVLSSACVWLKNLTKCLPSLRPSASIRGAELNIIPL